MLKRTEIEGIIVETLERIRYKPEFKVAYSPERSREVSSGSIGGFNFMFQIRYLAPNAEKAGQTIFDVDPIALSSWFSLVEHIFSGMNKHEIAKFVIEQVEYNLRRVEDHEFNEFFRVDGAQIYYPHDESERNMASRSGQTSST